MWDLTEMVRELLEGRFSWRRWLVVLAVAAAVVGAGVLLSPLIAEGARGVG